VVTGATQFSRRYETMLGHAPSDVADQDTWIRVIHSEDLPAYNDAISGVLEHGREAYSVEFRVRARSGAFRWILSRAKVVARDGEGRPTRIVGTHTDVTERRKLEEEFRQAQKLESVGRLAGGIAHDFNNLLTVINGYSDVLIDELGPGTHTDVLKHLDGIRQAGERAASMTRQLLAFSRKQEAQTRMLHLNAVIREFDSLMRRLVNEDVTLEMDLQAQDDRILADPGQIHQVLMNLVVNARDAMPRGGTLRVGTADVTVSAGEGAEDPDVTTGPFVRLDVTDTGTGMTPEVRSRIFEPFFTTKERGKGTGLGLSTVYGIVRQAGGFVRVESEAGRGTTFRIFLPRTNVATAAAEPMPALETLRGTETILVVEDLEPVRMLAVDALKSRGFHVLEAPNGHAALRVAEAFRGPIHVLLTDVVMPGMDGKTLADKLLALRPDTKVILMSGYADDVMGSNDAREPGLAYIDKPFTLMALTAKVREVLRTPGRSSSTDPLDTAPPTRATSAPT
jgi:PAS domain S-box-containing protein